MIRKTLLAGVVTVFAACSGGAGDADEDARTVKANYIEAAVRAGCVESGEPEDLCACLAENLVLDLNPDLLTLFHDIISADGVEELNHGDWMDTLTVELKSEAETHMLRVRGACAPQ